MANKKDEKIIKETINYCKNEVGLRELTLSYIGKIPEQPETIIEILKENKLPDFITFKIIKSYATQLFGFKAVNYFAHYGFFRHVQDFINCGLPEYPLDDFLRYNFDYMEKRPEVIIINLEEMLRDSVNALKEKYGENKVKILERKYNLGDFKHLNNIKHRLNI